MKLVCGPEPKLLPSIPGSLPVVLYGQSTGPEVASAGEQAKLDILRQQLRPTPRAWDFLSIALSVVTADHAQSRSASPDGWTREFELHIAVQDPAFWATQATALAQALGFLTTDRWTLAFHANGYVPEQSELSETVVGREEDCVVLLSGGLDSLVGALDLVAADRRPLAVSQTVRGDAEKQVEFAHEIVGSDAHLQLNPVPMVPGGGDNSQRARSLAFIAFGVMAATCLRRYAAGDTVPLFLCENGFIAINPPLTGARLGSLSTRTAHPDYLGRLDQVLAAAGLRVRITNPYAAKTKGEMLRECKDQKRLRRLASSSTSCGRFLVHGYRQCGRCIPCQIRRAAMLAWGRNKDQTDYKYEPLGASDADHATFDDVRSVAMALVMAKRDGVDRWLGNALSSPHIADRRALRDMIERGLVELRKLHRRYQVG